MASRSKRGRDIAIIVVVAALTVYALNKSGVLAKL